MVALMDSLFCLYEACLISTIVFSLIMLLFQLYPNWVRLKSRVGTVYTYPYANRIHLRLSAIGSIFRNGMD